MNGLSDTDIALFGELEVPNALDKLSAWFELRTPSAKRRSRRSTVSDASRADALPFPEARRAVQTTSC